MLSNEVIHDTKASFLQYSGPTKHLRQSQYSRIRAIKNASDNDSHNSSGSDTGATGGARHSSLAGQIEESSLEDSDNENNEASETDALRQAPESNAASISFGALVKAQAFLGLGKRNRSGDDNSYTNSRKSLGKNRVPREFTNDEALERRRGKKDARDFLRTSKHAPAELSCRKAVSRKREVVRTKKTSHRDPRFEPSSGAVDGQRTKKNYSFLDTYRDSEISDLKLAIRKTKDGEGKEKLKRTLLGMESRKKAQKMKEQQQEVLRKHRKEEKKNIEHGKRPFYLKKADQKKMALIERFESIKSKQVDKTIQRRWKKKAAKERKGIPVLR